MSEDYTLKFDLSSYAVLDNFAYLADQNYNLGSEGDWFNHFRGGLHGLYARVLGVQIHYQEVHSWRLVASSAILTQITEYHLSSILFNMDSAIECMVFTLNALGYAVDLTKFKDVTNEKELREISPENILGKRSDCTKGIILGYDIYFPSLKSYWHEHRDLIYKITEQHDVSKHRTAILGGGRHRIDPPPGLFEMLGIEDKTEQIVVSPWMEITLVSQPKTPWRKREPQEYKNIDKLEDVAERFRTFINTSGVKALEDANSRIKLNHYELIKQ